MGKNVTRRTSETRKKLQFRFPCPLELMLNYTQYSRTYIVPHLPLFLVGKVPCRIRTYTASGTMPSTLAASCTVNCNATGRIRGNCVAFDCISRQLRAMRTHSVGEFRGVTVYCVCTRNITDDVGL